MAKMPDFQAGDTASIGAGTLAGIGGIGNAIPFLNVIMPGITAAMAQSGKQAAFDQMGKNAEMLQGPEYGSSNSINNVYSGDYTPNNYNTPEAAQYSLAQESPEGRAAQMEALKSLGGLVDQSASSSSALGRNNAELDARQLAQSREGAIRQDAMRRGQVGGAADMIARQQAAQAGANMNLNAGLQNAQQAALMQLAGTQASGNLAGSMRGQDQNLAFNNANAINAFNMHNTDARNAISQANTGLGNAAMLRNLGARQDVNNANTKLAMDKLNRNDRNTNSQYDAEMNKYNAINDVLKGRAGLYEGAGQAAMKAGEQGYSNLRSLSKFFGGGMNPSDIVTPEPKGQ